MQHRCGPRVDPAIGTKQVIQAGPPKRFPVGCQPFGTATCKNITVDAVTGHQLRASVTHRIKPPQPLLQPQRQFLGARVFLFGLGQQQTGFEIGKPRRHHEIIRCLLERDSPGAIKIFEILIDQRQNRNLAQVHFLRPCQRKQKVKRPLPSAKVECQTLPIILSLAKDVRQAQAIHRAWRSNRAAQQNPVLVQPSPLLPPAVRPRAR